MITLNFIIFLLPGIIIFSIILTTITSHLLRGSYVWQYSKPHFYLSQRIYMRFEFLVMRLLLALSKVWIIRRSRFLQLFLVKSITFLIQSEVYTLDECLKIIDSIYKEYPNVYVGIRICPCRQARGLYDKDLPNITDLTFVYSKTPGVKKNVQFTKYISIKQAKELLKKFDNDGLVHTMFGNCGNVIDGAFSLAICNCKRDVCIPLDVGLDLDLNSVLYTKPHNLAIINQEKCKGAENCGKCLEICNFEARIVDKSNGKIKIINDKCYGCALCAHHCPEGANTIKFLPENKVSFYQNLFKDIRQQHLLKEKMKN